MTDRSRHLWVIEIKSQTGSSFAARDKAWYPEWVTTWRAYKEKRIAYRRRRLFQFLGFHTRIRKYTPETEEDGG